MLEFWYIWYDLCDGWVVGSGRRCFVVDWSVFFCFVLFVCFLLCCVLDFVWFFVGWCICVCEVCVVCLFVLGFCC